MRGLTNY